MDSVPFRLAQRTVIIYVVALLSEMPPAKSLKNQDAKESCGALSGVSSRIKQLKQRQSRC